MNPPVTAVPFGDVDLVEQLRRLRLLHPSDVVAAGLVVRDASRRHRLHLVDGPLRAVVKRPGSEGPAHALDRERRALEWLADGSAGLGPRVLAWDPTSQVLVTELLGGETLTDRVRRLGHLPPGLAARLGAALGALHSAPGPPDFAADVPGVLRLHRPSPAALGHRTRGQIELARLLQRDRDACAALDAAALDWRALAAIHGDVRWDNVIVQTPQGPGDVAMRLVDWELAGCGDPSWDVGSCIAAATLDELAGVSGFACGPTAAADIALGLARPATAAMWHAWADRMRLAGRRAVEVRDRAALLSGARLLQFAHEIAGESDHGLESRARLAARVGVNILKRPREAAEILLGVRDQAPLPPLR